MANYKITFFTAQYPDIDPNVSYDHDELDENLILVMQEGLPHNEAAKYFGIPMDVVMFNYKYDDIRRDYCFLRRPSFVGVSCGGYMFYDGNFARVIEASRISQYKDEWTEKYLVYDRANCKEFENKDNLATFICDTFLKERGYILKKGVAFRLSPTQIKEIDKKDKSLKLHSLFDSNNPNVFCTICSA